MKNIFLKYKPIRVHHPYFSYGWWWGKTLLFFNGEITIIPVSFLIGNMIYAKNGKIIKHGDADSWNRYFEQF